MRAPLLVAAIVLTPLVVEPPRAFAQSPLPGKVEAGVSAAWTGEAGLGGVDATETMSNGGTSRLFSSSSVIGVTPALEGRLGVRVTRRIDVEGFGSIGKTSLRSSLSNDLEGGSPVVATEDVTQYVAGVRVLWYPSRNAIRFAPTGRMRMYIAGGAAYLRELHQSSTLASTGQSYQLDVGFKRMLTTGSKHFRGWGIGGEAGIAARTKGVAFDNRTRFSPRGAVSLFSRF